MKLRWGTIIIVILIAVSLLDTGSVFAQEETPERDPVLEQAIYIKLNQLDPSAVPVFTAATQAMDRQDYATAIEGFTAVLQMVPDFPDALRRLGNSMMLFGSTEEGLGYISRAYQIDPSPPNQSAYAHGLIWRGNEDDGIIAVNLAQKAVDGDPQEITYHYVLIEAALFTNNETLLKREALQVLSMAPEDPNAHLFMALNHVVEGEMKSAHTELLKARELGLTEEYYQSALEDFGISGYLRLVNTAKAIGYTFTAWLFGFPVLLVIGNLLSRRLLNTINVAYTQSNYQFTESEKWLRGIYRAVIGFASAYYYISIPFLILLILVIFGGAIYAFFYIGQVPIRLALLILVVGLGTLIVLLRSIFIRTRISEPDRKLTSNEAPQLWEMVKAVASKCGTRSVDAIYITPGTDISVSEINYERSKNTNSRNRPRNLILGLGGLSSLNQSQFQAILAHEYGHFINKDTAGGTQAWRVNQSILAMAHGLAMGGMAVWFNPAWWFIRIYAKIFARITLGASRLQEYLADRQAALLYGIESLLTGLRKIIYRDLEFRSYIGQLAVSRDNPQPNEHNLYRQEIHLDKDVEVEMVKDIKRILIEPSNEYDSHPSYSDRNAYLQRIQKAPLVEWNDRPLIDLLPDYVALSEEMNKIIWTYIYQTQGRA
ncbi:MAG: M48 family metalloprotease [Anaerolineaceae bacterium]|nr:M48 family metalloprotease [Anaerolineaceae bacterium]MBN2677772.1 M48 family metalloprotease [Anaerolineaceae bacterium]